MRHAAPAGAGLRDYAWALTYWAPERLYDTLRQRLAPRSNRLLYRS